jgi:hypothetical protein
LRGADTSARADREQFYVRVYFTYDLKEWEERSGTVRYEVKGRRDNHMAGISVEYR